MAFSKFPKSRRRLSGLTAIISIVYSPEIDFPLTCSLTTQPASSCHSLYFGVLCIRPVLVVFHRRFTLGGNGIVIVISFIFPRPSQDVSHDTF